MSNDLRDISQEYIDILLADEVIAIDQVRTFPDDECVNYSTDILQDPLGVSAEGLIIVNNTNVMSAQVSVWHKPLESGERAVALLNTGLFDAAGYNLTLTSDMIGFSHETSFTARDLFAKKDLGTIAGLSWFWLEPSSITMLRVKSLKT